MKPLKELGKIAQSKSYMWLFCTSGKAKHYLVVYDYEPDRNRERPEEFLKDFSEYLHADGYEGYRKLPENITVVGCWAHLRRKFTDALKLLPKTSRKGLMRQRVRLIVISCFTLRNNLLCCTYKIHRVNESACQSR